MFYYIFNLTHYNIQRIETNNIIHYFLLYKILGEIGFNNKKVTVFIDLLTKLNFVLSYESM